MRTENTGPSIPRVLLIYPSFFYAPMDVAMMAVKPALLELFSYLRARAVHITFLDLDWEFGRPTTEQEIQTFLAKVSDRISHIPFDVAAISCLFTYNYLGSIAVADICRRINRHSCIVVGGNHPTALPSDFDYDGSPFDFIVRGDGETALREICQGQHKKQGTPTVIVGSPRDMAEDIPLDWTGYDYAVRARNNWLSLSRGCPYRCSFCPEQYAAACMGNEAPRWRSHPPEMAIRKVSDLRDALDPLSISFADPCFGFDRRWRHTFLGLLEKVEGLDAHMWMEIRGDLVAKEDIETFAKMNIEICLGVESGSPRMLKIMRKTTDPQAYLERYRELLSHMNEKEIPHSIEILFNHPGETYEDYELTLQFLRGLLVGRHATSGRIMAKNYRLFPGSHVFHHLEEYQREYGTTVVSKYWWKEASVDQAWLSQTALRASRDLADRFEGGQYWTKAINALNGQMRARRSPRARRIFNLAELGPRLNRRLEQAEGVRSRVSG